MPTKNIKVPEMNPALRIAMIQMLAEGSSTRDISDISGYPYATIETYRCRILKEFGVKNTPHLISKAYQQGILKIKQ